AASITSLRKRSRRFIPPPERVGFALLRPELRERAGVIQTTVLHHGLYAGRIPDVLQGIGGQELKIRELARFQRSQLGTESYGIGARGGAYPYDVDRSNAPGGERPELPVRTKSRHLTVGAEADPAT